MKPVLLTHWHAPGDIVCMTACVRDLALSHPGRYEIHIASSCPSLWENNPYISGVWTPRPQRKMSRYLLSCRDALAESGRTRLHYLTAFHQNLGQQLGIHVPVLLAKGDLYLSQAEQAAPLIKGPYWLIVAGGKTDIPVKIWSAARFQEVAIALSREGIRCVQAGALLPGHQQPELKGVDSFVGKTTLREFLRLVYHADGVICAVSFPMHVAAAFDKPCVVLAGGREPWWWEAYVNSGSRHFGPFCQPVRIPHRFLHTIGQLDCCEATGCWKQFVTNLDGTMTEQRCSIPIADESRQTIPKCLELISTAAVVAAVRSYCTKVGGRDVTV